VLVYLICPGCGKLVLACDEIGNVFDNLKEPLASTPLVLWTSAGQKCPACQRISLGSFHLATEDDLSRAGVASEEYEIGDVSVSESVRRLVSG
jgi:hypothetical protein